MTKKRKSREKRSIHPRNKYAENPPDFAKLASLYPSFQPYVFYSQNGRPRIDWTDFNATRELTRVLLLHDHNIHWWIPDGQLCPTVPNRSNYIHWIEDLLSSEIIPKPSGEDDAVKGFDIGTGANCIYPLLGASLLGWSFVGSDVTDVALEWAEKNVKSNPHLTGLIEVRKVDNEDKTSHEENLDAFTSSIFESCKSQMISDIGPSTSSSTEMHLGPHERYRGLPILVGVVKDDENFDFCMCNPPFFESMEEAGLNPKTSCGGTSAEMVCPGGELAFISQIIQDSVQLKQSFRWFTSMIGKKSNLKSLMTKLREVGASVVKTTEFVQGQTCRWGIAWSFAQPTKKILSSNVAVTNSHTFMLEGLQRQHSAFHVLQSVESFFSASGASCKSNAASFHVDISMGKRHCEAVLKSKEVATFQHEWDASNDSAHLNSIGDQFRFRISVFQQIPGTLLVKGSLQHGENSVSGLFSLIFQELVDVLREKFCRGR